MNEYMALSIFIHLSNFIYGILSFQHKLHVLNNLSLWFRVTTNDSGPPKHVGSLINKYVSNSVLCWLLL
jgi:hypothetical protein